MNENHINTEVSASFRAFEDEFEAEGEAIFTKNLLKKNLEEIQS